MIEKASNKVNQFLDGKITWIQTVISAVICGVVTGAILLLPALEKTSFHNMGVCFEFWFLAAVLIIFRCKKPWEASLKVFLFFLISQPLVYLVQVPFASLGWDIFMYYKTWFIWTLLTLPGAWIGWLITKRNWVSVVTFTFAILFLSLEFAYHLQHCLKFPPFHLITLVFILAHIGVYILSLKDGKKRGVLAAISALALLGATFARVVLGIYFLF